VEEDNPFKDTLNTDEALHAPARIALLLFLLPRTKVTFSVAQKALNITAGNLSSHLKKLEKSEFIYIEKAFIKSKPTTTISITSKGHSSIMNYVQTLNKALEDKP